MSGVLGANAPEPFAKNSKQQAVVWDGKDDQGVYIDDKEGLTVRVSLGLKPEFERTLLWSPHRQRGAMPFAAAAPEGVYVFDASGVDYLRLFDHDGNYVRTVYPFPADKLKDVQGLKWYDFPQGYRLPLKESGHQQTLLTSGNNCSIHDKNGGQSGSAATGMAVHGSRIALESANDMLYLADTPPFGDGQPGGRNSAHQALTLIQGYWFTGDKKHLQHAKKLVDANMARQDKNDGGFNANDSPAFFADGIIAESLCSVSITSRRATSRSSRASSGSPTGTSRIRRACGRRTGRWPTPSRTTRQATRSTLSPR